MYSFAGPAEVNGKYQKIRDLLQPVLIVIFLLVPWVKINEKPVLLLDFFNRHFVILGHSFFSHDAPLLFFLVILLILLIFIVTAVFGRLWCGWSCPQTVFLHSVYNKIEKLIMGAYSKRRVLYMSENNPAKKIKISFLYAVFILVSWILAHSFAAYFLGSDKVTSYIYEGPAQHLQAFTVLMLITSVLFFNFTFFRENLCLYICPYGRFQNALIDRNTLVVFFDKIRGEPRGKFSGHDLEKGDCVSCNRCVTVCPVKIDIRNGFQQECIACGKCIDACNDVMSKVKRQPFLIRYETGNQKKITLKRFRLVLYAGLILIFSVALGLSIANRTQIDLMVTRASLSPFGVRMNKGQKIIQNQLQIHLKNQTENSTEVTIDLSEQNKKDGLRLITSVHQFRMSPEQDLKAPAFVEIDELALLNKKQKIEIVLSTGQTQIFRTIDFIGVE